MHFVMQHVTAAAAAANLAWRAACRGEGSFGILAYGSCGYTNADGQIAVPQEEVRYNTITDSQNNSH